MPKMAPESAIKAPVTMSHLTSQGSAALKAKETLDKERQK